MTTAAMLLNVPQNEADFDIYSFALSQNVSDIRNAIREQKGVNLPEYVLYPAILGDPGEWLQRLSQAIGDICGELGINDADIENVDLNDARARQSWANQIFTEVNQARIILRI